MEGLNSQLNLLEFIKKITLSIWGDRHIGHYGRFTVVKEQINKLKPTSVLDAGCGQHGSYSNYISTKFPLVHITAIDIVKPVYPLKSDIRFFKQDLKTISFSNEFDLIISIDVLEHIDDYLTVLSNFYKALEKGGYLICHVPNKIQKRCFKRFESWHQEGHVRIGFDMSYLIEEMEKIGFEINLVKYTFGIFGCFAWELNRLTDWHWFKKLIKLIILPFLKILVFFDRKKEKLNGNGILILAKKV